MSIENYTNQPNSIQRKTGNNKYGEASFGTLETLSNSTRHQYEEQVVNGQKVLASVLYFAGSFSVSVGDRILFDGANYTVCKVREEIDFDGKVHFKKATLEVGY